MGRSPHGERGLKLLAQKRRICGGGRSPHGERGLKSMKDWKAAVRNWSLPARGAWIEIGLTQEEFARRVVAPRTGSVD